MKLFKNIEHFYFCRSIIKRLSNKYLSKIYITLFICSLFSQSCNKDGSITTATTNQNQHQLSLQKFEQSIRLTLKQLNVTQGIKNSSLIEYNCFTDEPSGAHCTLQNSALTQTISLPAPYSPCRAVVTYDLWWCYHDSNNEIFSIVFDNFSAYPEPGSDCQSLLDDWLDLWNNSDYEELDAEIEAFTKAAINALEEIVMQQLTYNNRALFPCGATPAKYLSSDFHTQLCYSICAKVVYHAGPPSYDELVWLETECGEACCKRTYQWCWNSTLNRAVKTGPAYSQVGDCDSFPGCPSGYTQLKDCEERVCEP